MLILRNDMNSPRIQHFVPQFFLRNFSFQDNGKSIGMFDLEKDIFRDSVAIRTQSAKDHFYGDSGKLEEWLGRLETKAAPIFKRMLDRQILPAAGSEEHFHMLQFALLLDGRNPSRFKLLKEFHKLIEDTPSDMTGEKLPPILLPSLEWSCSPEGMLSALTDSEGMIRELVDLQFKLLKNNTPIPFIISDNPLVIYNQLLEKLSWTFMSQRNYGFKGFQLFLPVSDSLTLIMYDANIYKVGNRKERVLYIDDVGSVDQLNLLQLLNATTTVNFNHQASETYLRELLRKSKRYTRPNQAFLKMHQMGTKTQGAFEIQGQKVELGITDLEIGLKVQHVRYTSKAAHFRIRKEADLYRKGIQINRDRAIPSVKITPRN